MCKGQMSGVGNYTRMHQSLYISKRSWAWRAGVVLGEFWDMTGTHHTGLQGKDQENLTEAFWQ